MKVEVMFVTIARTANHRSPAIVTYDDGPLVRALLRAGHVVLIDPPHLPGFNDDELPESVELEPDPVAPKLITNGNQEMKPKKRIRRQDGNEGIYKQTHR